MTNEDIEKAVRGSIEAGENNAGWCEHESGLYHDGFVDGAKWRINSVWHDGSIKPDTDKGDLLVIVQDGFGKDVHFSQDAYYVLKYGCKRWSYFKDLIPTEG